jgi:hypothetical protein
MKKQAQLIAAMTLTMLGLAGCAGTVDGELTKGEAAQALAEGEDLGDVCAEMAWYGDGECDSWCASPDSDCDGDDVACAEFVMEPDGVCSRPADDPCLFQDPDCGAVACPAIAMEPDGVCSLPPDDPCQMIDPDCGTVACAEYIEEADGVCSRPADDPCLFQDPDCTE